VSSYWEEKVKNVLERSPDYEETYTLPEGYLSPSQMSEYWRCPKYYYFNHIIGMERRTIGVLLLGTAVHKALEMALLTRMEAESEMPRDAILQVYMDTLNEKKKEADWEGADPGRAIDQGVNLLGQYVDHVLPLLNPVSVEEEFVVLLNKKLPFVGKIDLVDLGPAETQGKEPSSDAKIAGAPDIEVVDFKTAAKKYSTSFLENALQPTAYCYVKGVPRFRYDLLVKTKVPYVIQMRTLRDQQAGLWFEVQAHSIATAISHGNFPPTTPENFICAKGKCDAWPMCRGKLR